MNADAIGSYIFGAVAVLVFALRALLAGDQDAAWWFGVSAVAGWLSCWCGAASVEAFKRLRLQLGRRLHLVAMVSLAVALGAGSWGLSYG